MTPQFIAQSLGQNLPLIRPAQETSFTEVCTDSRKIKPGCLFVAIPGDQFDGHQFIAQAIQNGALGILCRKGTELPEGARHRAWIFETEDSLAGYRKLAQAWRRRYTGPLHLVAGSAGKTTTKELLAAIFSGKYGNVLKTQGSQNGFVGIAMTLLELKPETEVAIIEIGIDEIGAMKQHLDLVEPDSQSVAVLTSIGPEHLEKLIDLPTVAREEAIALSATASRGGTIAISLDDPWIAPLEPSLKTLFPNLRKITYSVSENEWPKKTADLMARVTSQTSTTLELKGRGLDGVRIDCPLPGIHNARNLLAAIAVATAAGLQAQQIQNGLSRFVGAEGRSQIRTLGKSTPVLCDYYNAQPLSVVAAIQLLGELAASGRRKRWACLGDMLELGPQELQFHEELAQPIQTSGVEGTLLYGPRMKSLERKLRANGYTGILKHFETHSEMANYLKSEIREGDVLLIKGSRGMRMESVWKEIQAHVPGTSSQT